MMVRAPGGGQGGDDAWLRPEGRWILAQQGIVTGGKGHVELGRHLLLPLADQRRWRQDEHALDHATQEIFFEHHAGFDRLAQANLVGQQDAPAKLFEYFAHGFSLVPLRVDAKYSNSFAGASCWPTRLAW